MIEETMHDAYNELQQYMGSKQQLFANCVQQKLDAGLQRYAKTYSEIINNLDTRQGLAATRRIGIYAKV